MILSENRYPLFGFMLLLLVKTIWRSARNDATRAASLRNSVPHSEIAVQTHRQRAKDAALAATRP
jgi:hypothetical protein